MSANTPLNDALASLMASEAEYVDKLTSVRAVIAGLRKVLGVADAPTPAARRAAPNGTRVESGVLTPGKHGTAAAAGREHVVLKLIAGGMRTAVLIREAMPVPAGITVHQHKQSIANAMNRMSSVKGLITREADGWTLTAKGRRAATAAKEVP